MHDEEAYDRALELVNAHQLAQEEADRSRMFDFPLGVGMIAAERRRQVEAEGYWPERDDRYEYEELASAAACYATPAAQRDFSRGIIGREGQAPSLWPWTPASWKPKGEVDFRPESRIRELVKAGALIAAEIDRIQRTRRAKGDS